MRPTRIVLALGGNALLRKGSPASAEEQLKIIYQTVQYIAEISRRGNELAIVHGNGPQVGNIVLAGEIAGETVPVMPLDVCGAMSQGYIGYHIQQALGYALIQKNRRVPVVTIVTQVIVDENDPAFDNPSKPIGLFYSKQEADEISKATGYKMVEDAGRGWRKVVASPMPKRIVEFSCLKELWDTTIVITAGGGGIPVVEEEDGTLRGIAAVIDKDLAASRLANDIEADVLMILTEVDKVALNYNKPNQQDIDHMTVQEAEKYMEEGHFAPGSMLPKIQAAVMYVKDNPGKKAIITSLFKSIEALENKTGTVIYS